MLKKLTTVLIILLTIIILIGCGEGRSNQDDIDDGYYYSAESFNLAIGINFEQICIFLHKEQLHLLVLEEDKSTLNSYLHLLTLDADGTNVQEVYRILIDGSVDFFHILGFEKHDDGYISLATTDSVILPPHTREDVLDGTWDYETDYAYVYRKISPDGEVVSKSGIDALNNDSRQIIVTDVIFGLDENAVVSGFWLTEGTIGQSLFLFTDGLTGDFHELTDPRLTVGLLSHTNDGRIIVPSYALSYGTDMVMFYEVDFENTALTEGPVIDAESHIDSIGGVFPAPEESEFDYYFINNNRELVGYRKSDETFTTLIDFLAFSVQLTNGGDRSNLLLWDDGRITVVERNWNGTTARNEATLHFLTPSDEPFISTQEIITLGWVDFDLLSGGWLPLSDQVVEFNRQSDTHRIEIVSYAYEEIDRLRTELIAGKGPDIIMLSGRGNALVHAIAEGPYMLDLYKMIDADPELKREDFFLNILSAWENSRGELVQIAPDFQITTMIGMGSVFPEAPQSWTVTDFIKFYDEAREAGHEYPLGTGTDRFDILEILLFADDTFFCEKTSTANFESEEFISVLNFVKTTPTEQEWVFRQNLHEDYLQDFLEGKQLLLPFGFIDSMPQFRAYQERFGGIIAFGYPSNDAPIHMLQSGRGGSVGIRSNSPHTEAAWEFVRLSLLPDAARRYGQSFALRIDLFEEMLDYEIHRTTPGGVGWLGGSLEYREMPESHANLLRNIALNVGHSPFWGNPVLNIVKEDASAFLAGTRSAEDTARIIQSRVQIFLSERER